ncbi:MAG TPA: hypothetical protein VFX02_13700 [Gammaproteobacteria bacterium]|nr:hypothetical protein [Gammaproteobacteria bacterium]
MKIRKILNSLLVFGFVLAVLVVARLVIERADQGVLRQARMNTHSTGTESITTYGMEDGALSGRVSALGIGADPAARNVLQARFKAVLNNGLRRPVQIRGMRAVTRGGKSLRQFDFSFEKAVLAPGQDYAFSGAGAADAEFFNEIVRNYDMALRVQTDIGELELPLFIYTLEVETALAAGLLKTNQVSLGEAQGIIHFLNCEQASADRVCEPALKQMETGGF